MDVLEEVLNIKMYSYGETSEEVNYYLFHFPQFKQIFIFRH